MICTRCEEGNITNVVFKKTGDNALLCDLCGALWFEGEKIDSLSAHDFRSFSNDLDTENSLEIWDDVDQDHSGVEYKTYK